MSEYTSVHLLSPEAYESVTPLQAEAMERRKLHEQSFLLARDSLAGFIENRKPQLNEGIEFPEFIDEFLA